MPKEITHWIIADRIHQQMKDCPLKSCLTQNIHMYYIGAVALDTPYYLTGRNRGFFQALASRLHGNNGENTYDPVYRYFISYDREIPQSVYAFLCGVITHIMIDSAFHPLVYYLTGDYNDPDPELRSQAIVKHRQWEAGLDLHISETFFIQDPGWLRRTINSIKIDPDVLLDNLCMLYFSSPGACRSQVKRALHLHAHWTNNAASRPLFFLYKVANRLSRGSLSPVLASFYPAHIDREYYKQRFEYFHTGWGEQRQESLLEIEQRAITSSLDFLNNLQNMPTPSELSILFKGIRGPSLETGI